MNCFTDLSFDIESSSLFVHRLFGWTFQLFILLIDLLNVKSDAFYKQHRKGVICEWIDIVWIVW